MNAPRLETLLEELYAADPELRAHDVDVRRAVSTLLAARPDVAADPRFLEELRRALAARSVELLAAVPSSHHQPLMKRLLYLVPGLAVVALAAVGALTVGTFPRSGERASAPVDSETASVERLGARAFGTLALGSSPPGAENSSLIARDQAGGGAAGMPSPAPVPPMAGGEADAKMMVLPPDWKPTIYRYAFNGALPELPDAADVYKRVQAVAAAPSADAFRAYGLGLLDLGRLRNPALQNFSLAEDREFGYVVNVSPETGSISIYENWQKWNASGRDDAAFSPLTIEQMPADAEIIGIADAFLAEYGIDKAAYGAPVVRNEWRAAYAAATDKSAIWIPDAVSVTYPILVDGQSVSDDSGYPYGLNVNVNVRQRRASGLYGLESYRFQSSSYPTVTDAERLLAFAREGGVNGDVYMPEGATTVELQLDAPRLMHVLTWQATDGSGLLVPALVFPVRNPPADHWRRQVVVPLVADLLNRPQPQPMPIDGMPVPTPLPAELK